MSTTRLHSANTNAERNNWQLGLKDVRVDIASEMTQNQQKIGGNMNWVHG